MIKKNRTWLIAIYAIVAVLVVLIIVSCFIPVNKKPEIQDPTSYYLKIDGVAEYPLLADKNNNKKRYDEINKIFNSSFSESFIVSLFSGRIGYNNRIESSSRPSETGYILHLYYEGKEPQKIMRNGEIYTQSSWSTDAIYYDEIIVQVTEGEGMTTHYFYYSCDPALNDKWGTDSSSFRYYRQSFVANFDALYDYLTEIQV